MSIELFLKCRSVEVTVGGNYTLSNRYDQYGKLRTFACRTSHVSAFWMLLDVPVVGRVGDVVSTYFAEFGNLTGVIAATAEGRFLLATDMTREKRARMSDQLSWLENKQKDPTVKDARKDARFVPVAPHSALTLADGSVHSCRVVDASISGVSVYAEVQPTVGTPLAVGACVGRVVRTLPEGFAVQFVDPHRRHDIERLLSRRARSYHVVRTPTPDRVADPRWTVGAW